MCVSNHNKKEWNLVVVTILFGLDYEISYLCRNDPSLKYRPHVIFSVDNFIKFSTQSINPKLKKKRLIKKFDIKQLVLIFTEGGKHKIITQTIS